MDQHNDDADKKNPLQVLTDSAKHTSDQVMKYSHQIWLAGLGAYNKAEQEGQRAFDHLVELGKDVEAHVRGHQDRESSHTQRTDNPTPSAHRKGGKIENAFDKRLSSALQRLGISNTADISALSQRIDQLQQKIDTLTASHHITPKHHDANNKK